MKALVPLGSRAKWEGCRGYLKFAKTELTDGAGIRPLLKQVLRNSRTRTLQALEGRICLEATHEFLEPRCV